jgi:hemoglobin/transferrin/lactoferrin receptor protein
LRRARCGVIALHLLLGGAAAAAAAEGPRGASPPAEAAPATRPADAAEARPAKPGWFDLPEILVTATRSEIEAFAAPYMTDTVRVHDFWTQRLYRTATKALEDVPGVMVQKTSHAQGSPYIRGFTGLRTVMLVDGIRLNNSVFRLGPNQYWNLIDAFTVDRLEVVRGPSSVLYGSDAIGGTVNAILRRPTGYGEGFRWHRQAYARVSTAERAYVGRGEVNATYDSWLGILVGGTWRDFGDVDGGGSVGPQAKTGYRVCSGDVRIEYHPDANTTWTLAHYQLYEDDAWRAHKTVHGIRWEGTTVGNELRRAIDESRSLTYLRFAKRDLGAFVDAVELTASFQTLRERRWRVKSNASRDRQGFDVRTYGVGAQFETASVVGRWTYGLEWYHDEVDSFAEKYNADGSFNTSEIQGPVGDDARYDLLGLYVQDRIPVADRLDLILGGRYTYARADADQVKDPDTGSRISVTDDWGALVGSARLSWFADPREHWNVFGGVSQGFRTPNLSDLTRLDTARTNEIETPSSGLDPERFLTYEAGVKARYENFSAQAAYFYTDIEDMIVRTPTGNVIAGDNEVTKKNAGNGYVHGVEVGARWRFSPQWSVFGSFAWLYGEVDTYPTSAPVTRSEPISRLMPPTGQLGLRWDHADKTLWAEAVCTAAGDADQLSTRDKADTQRIPPGGTPGYVTLDVRGGWRVADGLDVWAGLENVTNEDYRIHGSGVNEPGVNFKLGVRWRF